MAPWYVRCFFTLSPVLDKGPGPAVPPAYGAVAVFGVVVIDAVVVAIVTFKGRASSRVYAHLLAKKRRAEG